MPKYPINREFGFILNDVARLLRTYADYKAAQFGITRAQWAVLVRLERSEGLNQTELADMLDLQPITLTRLLDKLSDSGLIERRPDPGDRRAKRLFLTPAARPLLKRLAELGEETMTSTLAGVDRESIETNGFAACDRKGKPAAADPAAPCRPGCGRAPLCLNRSARSSQANGAKRRRPREIRRSRRSLLSNAGKRRRPREPRRSLRSKSARGKRPPLPPGCACGAATVCAGCCSRSCRSRSLSAGYLYVTGGRIMSTDDAYVQADKVGISTDVSGIVKEVAVTDNQRVEAGQVLYRLDPRQFQIALDNAKANMAQTAMSIEAMKQDYKRMLSDVAAEQAQVNLDQINYDRDVTLLRSGTIPQAIYDQAQSALATDKSKLESLRQHSRRCSSPGSAAIRRSPRRSIRNICRRRRRSRRRSASSITPSSRHRSPALVTNVPCDRARKISRRFGDCLLIWSTSITCGSMPRRRRPSSPTCGPGSRPR